MRPALVAASLVVGVTGCPSLASTLPAGCTKSTTIAVSDTVRTSFGTNTCTQGNGTWADFYNLVLTSQSNLVVSVASPGLATYLVVYDQNRTPIAASNLVSAPDTAATVRVMLATATYQIAVIDTLGKPGPYRLSISPDAAPPGCGLIWITPRITTTQTLTNSDCTAGSGGTLHYYHHYEMAMLFAQSATFTAQSNAYGPSLTLYSSLGTSQASSLDSTGSVATLAAFAQTQDYYQLWVGSVSALRTGAYTLTVTTK